ncbi:YsnF/AvaK domain-containing protein [Pseudoduganella chitinolytica]|uniref:YsnF/AvaK domain-containing protein n=1 Tax=Pseudoduganella chitinolytica TaxID=34070 RepID=A0ABY8BMS8_9BURK|nr:YsnF/AvaK domain-containing protein [Pseudoduganella chitinolytica]WEF35604.1 YsnF/AvaK domain-containing protein [Pseudoduganella chitinolytica]
MSHTLAAVFDNRADAERARDALSAAGIGADSVRLNASTTGASTTTTTGTGTTAGTHDESIGDSIKHFFSNLFGDDDERVVYGEAVNRGNVVLTVQTDTQDEIERAADVVEGFGPIDIDEYKSQWQASGWTGAETLRSGSGAQLSASRQSETRQDGGALLQGSQQGSQQGLSNTGSLQRAEVDEQVIPVMQEELKVGKRMVQRGGVRIYQRLVETPVQESVSLREEHVNVERRPVDRPIDPSQVGAFQETSFELRENAEEAVVQKTARVVEEVVVGKEVSQRTDQISDTVRSTQVDVEQLGSTDDDDYYRSHWTSNYGNLGGTFDDYAPAYRYGASMRDSDSYRGRSWDEAETTLRSNWESHYPTSAWDKFKAAVKHGWERMTS